MNADDDIDSVPLIDPYKLPEQRPRMDHPVSVQPPETIIGSQWSDGQNLVLSIDELLIRCRHLFHVAREPRKDPLWAIYESQLESHTIILQNQNTLICWQLDQIRKFLKHT